MKNVSIDELVEMVDSRYSLVTIISKRARQIIDGSKPLIETNTIKPVAIAIEEFYQEKYEAIYDYDKYLREKELIEKEKERKAAEVAAEAAEAAEADEINEEETIEAGRETEEVERSNNQE
ncbi:MAG: DNA-directed RNA polymerase subunit omega [Tissierellia bacterium]|nr:DNA-directed RNA polymerase subunit omega [Tissierellia bacterium]